MSEGDDKASGAAGPAEEPSLDSALGGNLFADVLHRFIEPEVQRRQAADKWDEDEGIRLFQVLWPAEGPAEVRLNGDVHGTLKANSTRAIEEGEEVTHDDFDGFSEYRLPEEDAGATHVTAIAHAGGWSLAFDLNAQHPRRGEFLAAGSEFAATAREALEAERLRAFREAAFSAAELFAKAELLSHGPAIEHVENARTHGGVRTPYNLWGNLRNTDRRFVRLLNRLDALRKPSRYLEGPLRVKPGEDKQMLALLLEMEAQVTKVAGGELSEPINVYATRDIKAGELVSSDSHALTPPGRPTEPQCP